MPARRRRQDRNADRPPSSVIEVTEAMICNAYRRGRRTIHGAAATDLQAAGHGPALR